MAGPIAPRRNRIGAQVVRDCANGQPKGCDRPTRDALSLMLLGFSVAEAADSERIRFLELRRELGLREVLKADWTREAVDGQAAD